MTAPESMQGAFVAVLYDEIENSRTLSALDELHKENENDRDDVACDYANAIEAAADALGLSTTIDALPQLHDWADAAWPAIAKFLTEDGE